MKFVYEYRTSDNVRHNGVVAASDREAAFAALKQQGIRPGFLAEAPGFFNKLFGKGKRWLAIGVLASIAAISTYLALTVPSASSPTGADAIFTSPMRRQIIGDAAVIEKGIATGWSDVFALEGDRFLASFAVPGVPAAVRSTTEDEIRKALDVSTVPGAPSRRGADMSLEARQILSIVAGMKKEINSLLASGWTLREVGTALAKRQDREIGYYERAAKEIERAKESGMSEPELLDLWEKRNDELRNLGIRLVPMPE